MTACGAWWRRRLTATLVSVVFMLCWTLSFELVHETKLAFKVLKTCVSGSAL
jgi:hypothetical protein